MEIEHSAAAAAFAWGVLRHIQWDPERDDPRDIELHAIALEFGRKHWPWLDEAADIYEGLASDEA